MVDHLKLVHDVRPHALHRRIDDEFVGGAQRRVAVEQLVNRPPHRSAVERPTDAYHSSSVICRAARI